MVKQLLCVGCLFIALLMLGCTKRVTPEQYEAMEALCKNNGGLAYYFSKIVIDESYSVCKDGVRIFPPQSVETK
jgi:hypothetical protein